MLGHLTRTGHNRLEPVATGYPYLAPKARQRSNFGQTSIYVIKFYLFNLYFTYLTLSLGHAQGIMGWMCKGLYTLDPICIYLDLCCASKRRRDAFVCTCVPHVRRHVQQHQQHSQTTRTPPTHQLTRSKRESTMLPLHHSLQTRVKNAAAASLAPNASRSRQPYALERDKLEGLS